MVFGAEDIEKLIKAGIPDAEVRIEDLRGDAEHFIAYISSASFAGQTRVRQHQMVYEALGDAMGEKLHSLAIQTSVPE